MTVHTAILHEQRVPGHRLGRHVEHDERSRAYAIARPPRRKLVSRAWKRHAPIFNQGDLGKCTAEAAIGCAMTEPYFQPGWNLGDDDATMLYEVATRIDKIAGAYPPDDTGSTGLAAAKAATRKGYFGGYAHAFSESAALDALAYLGPFMLGIKWFEAMDRPVGPRAEIRIGGGVRGGHEIEVSWIDVAAKMIGGPQSWGSSWGQAQGWWSMTFATFEKLLSDQGDVVVPKGVILT